MNTKIFNNAHFTPKGDFEANWNKAVGFIPLDKEVIIYKPDAKHSVARLKIGDGVTTVQDLPFITDVEGVASEEWVKAYGAELSELLKQYTDTSINDVKQYTDNAIAAINFPEFNQEYDKATENLILDKNMQAIPLDKIIYYDAMLKMIIIEGVHNICQNGDIILIGESHIEAKINSIYIDNSMEKTYFYLDRDIDPNLVEAYVYLNNVFSISAINSFEIKDSQARQECQNLKNNFDVLSAKSTEQDDKITELFGRSITATFDIRAKNTTIMLKNLNSAYKIDWGDGTVNNELSHTYVNIGEYTCKIYDVTHIGGDAFYKCISLTSVKIGDSVTSIGNYAFSTCTSLTSVEIGDSVTSIGNGAFTGCSVLTNVEIPDSVTSIGDSVFSGCSKLTSVVIGGSVTSIGSWAFGYCGSLTRIVIGGNVTHIGEGAFYGCIGLMNVDIPDSVISIGDYVFGEWRSLTRLIFKNPIPIAYSINLGLNTCPALAHIYVPYDCKQAYVDKWTMDGATQDILDKIVESDREANMSDVNALKSEIQAELVDKTDYLGTVAAMGELSTIAGAGDYHRVSAEFVYDESTSEVAHVGDILIAIIDTPGQNKECWDLVHTDLGVTPATAEDINSIFEEA